MPSFGPEWLNNCLGDLGGIGKGGLSGTLELSSFQMWYSVTISM